MIYKRFFGFSIQGLLQNNFYKYWKELFELGMIYTLETPIVKVKYKKQTLEFFKLEDFEKWKEVHKDETYTSKYYKGLGTSKENEWREYLSDAYLEKHLIPFLPSPDNKDSELFELLFSKAKGMADKRKEWMDIA